MVRWMIFATAFFAAAAIAFSRPTLKSTVEARTAPEGKIRAANLVTSSRATTRGWKAGGPCASNDSECMSRKMLEYVNDYRRSKGKAPLRMGTEKQFKNAMSHSAAMRKSASIYHQNLQVTKFGCESFFAAENVANNHCLLSSLPTDPARMCVDQFINSPPHEANLVNERFTSAVMGIAVKEDGYFYCTQTFAQHTAFAIIGECAECCKDDDDSALQMAEKGHVFKMESFKGMFDGGREGIFKLESVNNDWKYCLYENTNMITCLHVDAGIAIDKAFA